MTWRRICLCLVLLALTLVGCGAMRERIVYVRVDNGMKIVDYGLTEEGELVKLGAYQPRRAFDFSTCVTGDVLLVRHGALQEVFPANLSYFSCKKTGDVAAVEPNAASLAWLAEYGGQILYE